MMLSEAGALAERRIWRCQEQRRILRYQPIAGWLAQYVSAVCTCDDPAPASACVDRSFCYVLSEQGRRSHKHRIPPWILRAFRSRNEVELVDRIGRSVDLHVHANVEEMLVVYSADARGHER